MHIGFAIRAARSSKNLSRKDLASAAGISSDYLYAIERGTNSPTVKTLDKISEALAIEGWRLLRWRDKRDIQREAKESSVNRDNSVALSS